LIKTLQCEENLALGYKSPTQIARVVTENWCAANLYCAGCRAESLNQARANAQAIDFYCNICDEKYQLKSQKHLNLSCITDGAYNAMLAAVKKNSAPNLLILNYSPEWIVKSLFLVPSLFFTASVLQRRPPLSAAARRAGWVGCNIILSGVPDEAKISVVKDGTIASPRIVRQKFAEYQSFASLDWELRGWTLDVLQILRQLGDRFTLRQVYEHELSLARLHPANKNVRAKIRQQLQVLRDLGFLRFIGNGCYEFRT
jgi:type II restriction enzyme